MHYFNILFSLTFPFLHFIFLYGNFPFLAEWKYKFVLHFGMRISSLLKQIWFLGLLFLIQLKPRDYRVWGAEFRTMLFICFVLSVLILEVPTEFSEVKLGSPLIITTL